MAKKVRIKDSWIIRLLGGLFLKAKGFKVGDKYKAKKGEKIIILSNHVTNYDPMFVRYSTNRFCYTLGTDTALSTRIGRFWLPRLGIIPKKKGIADIDSLKRMLSIAAKGGSLSIFPEGNRSYADFQYFIADNFASLMYKLKATIVLFNIVGGFGNYPRFSKERRKGILTGKIKRVLPYEEYKDMSVEQLNGIIKNELKYFDEEVKHEFKSSKKAEYLEREFFVCPKCGHISSLYSKGDHLYCKDCGLDVTYTEHLALESKDESFKFTKLSEWYNFQKDFVKNMGIKDEVIFKDNDVILSLVNPYVLKKTVAKGDLVLTKDTLSIGDFKINVKDILIASPVSGTKLVFVINKDNYEIEGNDRFNALKYVLMFNKLETRMKLEKVDEYYNL